MKVTSPNFLVLGAPKAGTSSMHKYFLQHHQIFVPKEKEVHYFSDDIPSRTAPSKSKYFSLFDNVNGDRRIGDVAVLYMYSKTAISNIVSELGNVDVICAIREPVEALQAYHQQMLLTGNEDIEDLEEAIRLQVRRKRGDFLPKNLHQNPALLQYLDIYKYGSQLERILDHVNPEKVHLVFFDDFKADTKGTMEKIYASLGCDSSEIDYKTFNQSQKVRSKSLQNIVLDKNGIVRSVGRTLLTNRMIKRTALGLYRTINSKSYQRKMLEKNLKAELQEYFAEEVKLLEDISGRTLKNWYINR